MFNANVKQVINVTQICVGKMITDKKPGAVVNVSSQASQVRGYMEPSMAGEAITVSRTLDILGQAALADHTVYCATKGALDMVTKYVIVSVIFTQVPGSPPSSLVLMASG